MNEYEPLPDQLPDASAYHAVRELHYGRIDWLAEHIRCSNFQVHPEVARKLLAMIEGTDSNCFFEIRLARRSDMPPRAQDPQLSEIRDAEMAIEVARLGGVRRGHLKRACHKVAEAYGLKADYVERQVRSHRDMAIQAIEAEELQQAYERGEVDFLGRPKSP